MISGCSWENRRNEWTNVRVVQGDFIYELESLLGYDSWVTWVVIVLVMVDYVVMTSMDDE